MKLRLWAPLFVIAILLGPRVSAQDGQDDRAEKILKKIDEAIKSDSERVRKELIDIVRAELAKTGKKQSTAAKGDVGKALELVTADLLKDYVGTLAGDDFEGRQAGYPGNDKAADYIAEKFKKDGLLPKGDNGAYLQHFEFESIYTGASKHKTQNVVGLLEGSDPSLKKEIVVIGGHFDHLGKKGEGTHLGRMGKATDKNPIWSGADDNASGASTVMALARAFAEGGIRTKRSILFICFSAEEAGLYGSQYYVDHPTAGPIGDHVFMLNMDMVGRNPDKPVEIKGLGSAENGVLNEVVKGAIDKTGLKAALSDKGDIFGGDSDHTSFKNAGVPYTFFFTGFHADYHRPTDHADKIAYDHMVTIAQTGAHILIAIADRDERPRLTGKGDRPKSDFGDTQPPDTKPRRMLGVSIEEVTSSSLDDLGLDSDQGGLKVLTVNASGVAKDAGVKEGDIILSANGKKLGRDDPRGDLRGAIAAASAGKDVPIVVLRGKDKVTLQAKWDK